MHAPFQIERRLNSKVPELTMQYEAKLSKAKDLHQHLQELKPIIGEVRLDALSSLLSDCVPVV